MQSRTVINECYIVRERLGEDGFCELWRATSVFNATEFLLRFFKPLPGLVELAPKVREAIMASYAVSHQAVTDIVDFEQFEGRFFIASPYAGQKPLRALLGTELNFGLEQVCRYLLELAQGIDVFHSLGIVYACFNSENALFLISQGRVEAVQVQKPGYFPLLGLLRESDREDWVESWAYVAPEIKKGKTPDQRADVYSLGIHLFRFLTGKLPFTGDLAFVHTEAASLVHVAKALLRRGVPEALIRIAIRALRPDPAQRYVDCVHFIAELRAFTDERRALWVRKSGIDPLANIETLNRAGGRIGASQIVRSLDTADYFRQITEAPVEVAAPKATRSFPFSQFSDPDAVRNLENAEAGAQDPGDKAEDSYLTEARRAVGQEPWAVKEDLPTADEAAGSDSAASPAADSLAAAAGAEEPSPSLAGEAEIPIDVEPMDAEGIVIEAPRPRKRSQLVGFGGIEWKSGRLRQKTLVGMLEEMLARAKHGRGTFSFVEEPAGEAAAALGRAIGRFRDEAIVTDMKDFPEGADATDFLRMFRSPLSASLAAMDQRTLRLLGKRLMAVEGESLLGMAPIGSLLFGIDRPEPDPAFLATLEGAATLAKSIICFGRRSMPLVVFCRAGELAGRTAHDIMMELAARSPFAPFCCVVFFRRDAKVPAWHSLSKLEG